MSCDHYYVFGIAFVSSLFPTDSLTDSLARSFSLSLIRWLLGLLHRASLRVIQSNRVTNQLVSELLDKLRSNVRERKRDRKKERKEEEEEEEDTDNPKQ